LPRTEIRVETLERSGKQLLAHLGLSDHMINVLVGLDVILDPGTSADEDFWGLIRSELGMSGISCDDLPGRHHLGTGSAGAVMILERSNLPRALRAVASAVNHWMERGHSAERFLELVFLVSMDGGGMERAEVRGPASSIQDALIIGEDGFSEVGQRKGSG